jgi:hypothetical protein
MTKASAASPTDDLAGYQYLIQQGVTDFATVNEKDFRNCGFRRVWNPLAAN